jgi:hypothetical protein
MPPPVRTRDGEIASIIRAAYRTVLPELRRQARRVRKGVVVEAPKSTTGGPDGRGGRIPPGNLRRRIRLKSGVDRAGPWARLVTTARNPKTGYRYGLAIQQRQDYLGRGLARTPRE